MADTSTLSDLITDLRPRHCPLDGLVPPALFAAAKERNVALDRIFYDMAALTQIEIQRMVKNSNREGTILVVYPRGDRGLYSIGTRHSYESLCKATGKKLTRFSIAGVGSSDLGAVALARQLADHYLEPVGAIVAGYGFIDAFSEALGGWFVLGTANRLMQQFHELEKLGQALIKTSMTETEMAAAETTLATVTRTGSPEIDTLLQMLLDEDRQIETLLGHSKGCLSIALALESLADQTARAEGRRHKAILTTALHRAKAIRVITTGAVVALPSGFDNVVQFRGALDMLGRLNSRPGMEFESVPSASHHLNTQIPFHMDLAALLAKADNLKTAGRG